MKPLKIVAIIMMGLGLGRCFPDKLSGPSCTDVIVNWDPEVDSNSAVASNESKTVETGQSIAGVDDAVKVTLNADATYLMLSVFTDPLTDPHQSVTVSFDVYTAYTGLHVDRIYSRGFTNLSTDSANGLESITPNQWNTISRTIQRIDLPSTRNLHFIMFNGKPVEAPDIPADTPFYFKNVSFAYSCQ